ncbi:MAG: glutathione S-transferase family protein [Proteobacteria bacterium]|nr:glutathione S-transferase family protein [Pseudomonadota bacterium]
MSTLTIYGHPRSRASRVYWMAHELGLAFDHVPVSPRNGESRAPDYLAINPNGHVPAIVDGDLVMWESLAINLYLAKKHGGPLAPVTIEEEALAIQWTTWVINEAEGSCTTLIQVQNGVGNHPPDTVNKCKETLQAPLTVLNSTLSKSPYLLGDRFTVADLNVSMSLSPMPRTGFDLSGYPKVMAWLDTCLGRPALQAAQEMAKSAPDT